MDRSPLEEFILKAASKPIPFIFCNPEEDKWKFMTGFPAWTSPEGEIAINQIVWNTLEDADKLWIILHEIGHTKDKTRWNSSPILREFFAQRWAMNRSKTLKIPGLYKYIKRVFQMWEFIYEWNSDHRRYILASKLAKQKGII